MCCVHRQRCRKVIKGISKAILLILSTDTMYYLHLGKFDDIYVRVVVQLNDCLQLRLKFKA